MSRETGEFAKKLLNDPVKVEAAPGASTLECIEERVFFVDQNNKYPLLQGLLKDEDIDRALIFTRTKHRADKLAQMLGKNQINADAIHGNKSQNQRTKAMQDFKSGRLRVLVATDIAARGIDVDDISHVINFDLPSEPESYVHRIGRTGRAGARGMAYSFCAAEERNMLRSIERLTRTEIECMPHTYHSEKAKIAVGAAAEPVTPNRSRATTRDLRNSNLPGSGRRNPYPMRRR